MSLFDTLAKPRNNSRWFSARDGTLLCLAKSREPNAASQKPKAEFPAFFVVAGIMTNPRKILEFEANT
jgi:hypothetical protein